MPGKIYKGKNVRFSANGKTLYHSTSCNISISTPFEELATKDTEGTVVIPGDYTWSAGASSLVAEKDISDTDKVDFMSIVDLHLDATEIDFEFTTNETGDFLLAGKVYVETSDITAENGNSVSGSFAFKGSGKLTKSVVPA